MVDASQPMTPGMRAVDLSAPIEQREIQRAVADVPRHVFVPESRRMRAYLDIELPLGHGRVAMRPSAAARLLDVLRPQEGANVLVVMAGDAYLAALAASLGCNVTAVEPDERLAEAAADGFARAGLADRVTVRHALPADDGTFDAIFATGALERTPRAWMSLLASDGSLVVPVQRGSVTTVHVHVRTGRGSLRREAGDIDVPSLVGVTLPGA